MRQAYIVHILDTMLSERATIALNDKAVADEEAEDEVIMNGQRVTLDNVFDLAKNKEGGEAGSDDNESDDED